MDKGVLLLFFENDEKPLAYDYSTLPNIEPIQNMVKNFKSDGAMVYETVKFTKYFITMGSKTLIKLLIELVSDKYKNITLDNIYDIIACADYYQVDIDYTKISKRVMIKFLNNIKEENYSSEFLQLGNSFILNKLFSNDNFTKKYGTLKRFKKLCTIVNDLRTFCSSCSSLYYDEQYNTYAVLNNHETHTNNDIMFSTCTLTLIHSTKNYKFEIWDFEHFHSEVWSYKLILRKRYKLLKCIFFKNNKIVTTIDFTTEQTPFGVNIIDSRKLYFIMNGEADCIYFVYKNRETTI